MHSATADLAGLADGLRPGDVACLKAGVYGALDTRTNWTRSGTSKQPITVRAVGDGPVQLRGFINMDADYLVFDGVVFDGPTGDVDHTNAPHGEEVLVWVQGRGIVLRNCEVRDGHWRAGVYITGPDTTMDSCWVHDIGPWEEPGQKQVGGRADNIDQGVYWGRGSSGTLVNSVIEHNLAYGIQISDGAANVAIVNNTIVRNGSGGIIWADGTSGSSLVNNVIAYNDGYAVNAHLLTGTHNVARHNLAWGDARGEWNDNGPLIMRANDIGDPRFVSMRDYRLRAGSPAIDMGADDAAPQHDASGARRPQGAAVDLGAYERSTGTEPRR